jgi:hypothetical protein
VVVVGGAVVGVVTAGLSKVVVVVAAEAVGVFFFPAAPTIEAITMMSTIAAATMTHVRPYQRFPEPMEGPVGGGAPVELPTDGGGTNGGAACGATGGGETTVGSGSTGGGSVAD